MQRIYPVKCPVEKPTGFNESNDCTVRAIATVLNIPYLAAWTALKHSAKRQRHEGVMFDEWLQTQTDIFEKVAYQRFSGTVDQLRTGLPSGKYLFLTYGHTFAVIDSIVYDYSYDPYEPVIDVWKVK